MQNILATAATGGGGGSSDRRLTGQELEEEETEAVDVEGLGRLEGVEQFGGSIASQTGCFILNSNPCACRHAIHSESGR